jgi:hypothetical protein
MERLILIIAVYALSILALTICHLTSDPFSLQLGPEPCRISLPGLTLYKWRPMYNASTTNADACYMHGTCPTTLMHQNVTSTLLHYGPALEERLPSTKCIFALRP